MKKKNLLVRVFWAVLAGLVFVGFPRVPKTMVTLKGLC